MLYTHHSLGGFAVSASASAESLFVRGPVRRAVWRAPSHDSIRSLPARVGFVPRSRVGSSWRSWLFGTALGGVLAACGGGGGGGGGGSGGGGGGNTDSNSAPTTTTLATATTALTAEEGEAMSWTVSAWFSDADGDELTFTASLQEKDDATAMALAENHWLMLDEATGALTIEANATDDAQVGVHTLVLTASDGTASATHSLLLTITDDRDGDPVTNADPHTTLGASVTLTAQEEDSASWDASDWFSDQDEDDTLTFTGTLQKMDAAMATTLSAVDWLELDEATGALTIAANATDDEHVGVYTLVLTASDGTASVAHTVTLVITDDKTDGTVTNAPPVTTTDAPAMLEAKEEEAASWNAMAWFTDTDAADALTYTGTLQKTGAAMATALADVDWLVLNEATGALTIAASATDDDEVGVYTLVLTASDGMASVTHSLFLTITDDPDDGTVTEANSAPVTTTLAMTSLTAMEGIAADWDVSDWFSDPDTGDTLTYTETGLPDWLELDDTKNELAVAASATNDAQVGSHTFTITATDDGDETAVLTVTLTVENVAEAPVTTTLATTSLTAMEGSAAAVTWDVSTWFSDGDTNIPSSPDVLTYAATGLPDWLGLNAMTGALTIAARATDDADIGTYVLAVTASDKADAMVAHTTTLTIADTENEPTLSAALPTPIVPVTGGMVELDLTDYFSDFKDDGTTLDDKLTFTVSDSILDTADENIITAMITGAMLTLTPGAGSGPSDELWKQETVTITATDSDDKQTVAEFAVTTRAVIDVSALAPARGFIIQGDVAADRLGFSVSGAGDINGDGLADLITGAPLGDDGGNGAGEAYIVYGKANPANGAAGTQFGMADSTAATRRVVDATSLAPADGFRIQSDALGDRLGWSVSGAGDINGDGIGDLIVGAPFDDDGGDNAGEAYIVYGKTGTAGTQFGITGSGGRQVLDISSLASADGFRIQGDERFNRLGQSVAGIGDVNGDGIDDLITGAYFHSGGGNAAGAAYIVYGKVENRQLVDTTGLARADGFIIQGDRAGDELGFSVSGAGDVNGDGLADLIVGAPKGNDGGSDAGEAYIVYGKANPAAADGDPGTQFGTMMGGSQLLDTTNLAPAAGFILQGDTENDRLGFSVSGAGDINGDGIDDLIAGANEGNDGGSDAGEAYIVYGKAGDGTQFGAPKIGEARRVLDTTNLAPAAGFIIQGDNGADRLGWSVSGAGDINGDGLADLIAGAYWGDDGGMDAGEAYIIYGKAGTDGTQFGSAVTTGTEMRQVLDITSLAPTDGFIIQGEAFDQLGISVSGAGDVNGDGFDDLIAGASLGDDGGADAGEAYVVYGGTHLGEVVSHAQALEGGMVPTLPDSPTPAQQEAAARAPFLLGGAGDDRLEAHVDTEVLYGGAGDDVLVLADDSFRRVDGGSGDDRLVLGTSLTLDLTDATVRGKVRGIETLSLSDGADVTLNLLSVYALVESRNNGGTHTSAGEAFLRLEGVGMVVLEGGVAAGAWTLETMDAEGPDLYVQGSAKLLIDDGLVA